MDQLSEQQKKFRTYSIITAFVFFVIFVLGLFFIAVSDLDKSAILTLSFVAGLSMIFLPCTLPLVFIIVPLSMGDNYKKGFLIALLFGLGLSITLSLYGVGIAYLGGWLGLVKATEIMFTIAGTAAFIFGLSELGFIKFQAPGYGGKVPDFIQKQGDYVKSFFLGLFLGNAGVGCPNPAFYILLGYIATVGSITEGWYLGFIHGVGRSIPLVFLAILGILGVNATGWVVSKKQKVERFIGWALTYIGAFIFMNGVFGHDWYVQSGIHAAWEKLIAWFFNTLGSIFGIVGLGGKFGELIEHHHDVISSTFFRAGNWVMVILFAIPLIFNYFSKRKELKVLTLQEVKDETSINLKRLDLSKMLFKYILIILILIIMFVFYLPSSVLPKKEIMDHESIIRVSGGYNRQIDLHKYLAKVDLSVEKPLINEPFELKFTILDKSNNKSITDLKITHEKPVHLILVREDLNEFSHLHPELKNDSYIINHSFSKSGYYKAFVEFSYQGEVHIFDFLIDTANPVKTTSVPDFSTSKIFNGYEVKIHNEEIYKNKDNQIRFEIFKDNQLIETQRFLGTKGHLVAIDSTLLEFIHTHAEDMMEDHHGQNFISPVLANGVGEEKGLNYLVDFSKAGLYKLWMQTIIDGEILTADFMVEVKN